MVLVERDQIREAAARLGDSIRRTPVLTASPSVTFKLELLQHTGSFKPRGALNRALIEDVPSVGVIAASGGNHGLAVAWVAQRLGVPAEIFVPEVSPVTKVDKLRTLGATVHVVGALYDDALAACRLRQAETGALDIHAYDHVDTIAGAGTIGLEIDDQVPEAETVLVSVGGGGLSSGVAAWFGGGTQVVAIEPESSRCFSAAIEAGEPVDVPVGGIAADSLGARRIGTNNWEVLTAAGATSVLVTDAAVQDAQRRMWSEFQLIVEPGGATAAAALWSGAYVAAPGEHVVVIVCGANTDPASVT